MELDAQHGDPIHHSEVQEHGVGFAGRSDEEVVHIGSGKVVEVAGKKQHAGLPEVIQRICLKLSEGRARQVSDWPNESSSIPVVCRRSNCR